MKKTLLFLGLLLSVVLVKAQGNVYGDFAYGFGATAGTTGNLSFVVGMPFYTQPAGTSYSLSEGVMQAQLIQVNMVLSGCQNDSLAVSPAHVKDTSGFFLNYPGENIVFRGETINVFPAGEYDSTGYDVLHYNKWGAKYNYDSLTTLLLNVYPIYEFFDTLYLDSTNIVTDYATNELHIPSYAWHMLHGGPNEYELKTVGHDCDSIRHFFVNLCGGTVRDADGNPYASVYVGSAPQKYCWTKSNMKTTKYMANVHDFSAGDHVANMIYCGGTHTDTTENLNTFGRLYNWYATVGLADGSDENPDVTTNGGFVTGICPIGWHIPDSANLVSFNSVDAFDVMANILWIEPGHDTGAGFYALPAGLYNHNTGRFENMTGQTLFWSSVRHTHGECWVCSLLYGCNHFLYDNLTAESGVSVRCVKNQMYNDAGEELNN